MAQSGETALSSSIKTHVHADHSMVCSALNAASRSLWLGVTSFEERCSASLEVLHASGVHVTRAIALEYAKLLTDSDEERVIRHETWNQMKSSATAISGNHFEKEEIEAYSYQELQERIRQHLTAEAYDCVVVDITCMTKLHALALASMVEEFRSKLTFIAAYTIPENYNHVGEKKRSPGWQDIILAPLAETARLRNESQSRGIVLPGHEADRLIVALSEIEPSSGVLVFVDTPRRPDLRFVSQRVNRKILRQLINKRSSAWSTMFLDLLDSEALVTAVTKQAELAKQDDAPVILLPYGPKSCIFLSAYTLANIYPDGSWFVYPIPHSYVLDYSDGVERVIWIEL